MDIREAIEKDDANCEFKLNCWRMIIEHGRARFEHDGKEIPVPVNILNSGNWRPVREERIEVGDTATYGHSATGEVIGVWRGVHYIRFDDGSIGQYGLSDIKLIRKGSKRHVFEGVGLKGSAVDPWINLADLYRKGLPDIAKTYRMTLEEME